MNWHIPKDLTFEDALQLTRTLTEAMVNKKLKDSEIEEIVTTLVNSENGARGFFVVYFTSDLPLADNPSEGVVNALKTSPEIVSELLVKNLAMSSAMSVTHRRNNDENIAKSSEKVAVRNGNLIKLTDLELSSQKLAALTQTIINNSGIYQAFLDKWEYDEEQKQTIQKYIESI